MNHRLKDKAATLSATSLQGDKDEGVRGQVPDRCPKTPNPGMPQHSVQRSRTGVHEFKPIHKHSLASPGYSLRENKSNQNTCVLLSKLLVFFFLILSSRVKNNTGFAQVETSFCLTSWSKDISKTVSSLAS